MMNPPPHLPPPLRTNTSNAFAHDTLARRVPEVVLNVVKNNPDYPERIRRSLETLAERIREDQSLPEPTWTEPDQPDWHAAWNQRHHETWLNTVWFFAETYVYRLIIDRVRWWETGRDPFAPNKDQDYSSDAHWDVLGAALDRLASGDDDERFHTAITNAMWGNRMDLSFAASLERGIDAHEDDLIVNEIDAILSHLNGAETGPKAIHFVLDNAGTEFSMDMVLADLLLERDDITITLHAKHHPTFVSDVTAPDVWDWLNRLDNRGGDYAALSARMRDAFEKQRLSIRPHSFWNSSRFLWEMPDYLMRGLRDARLVIVKGDANYRRLVGDALWPEDTPFRAVVTYWPTPIIAMRALKSDPIVGLKPGQAADLDAIDPDWRTNGQRGVIQFNR
jgi:uncharacterized protein with ATP-grasp and redox domains